MIYKIEANVSDDFYTKYTNVLYKHKFTFEISSAVGMNSLLIFAFDSS
jgi:hypothetical protein